MFPFLEKKSLWAILSIIFLLVLSGRAAIAGQEQAKVKEIKHWSNPSYTRIVINLDRKAEFTHRLLKKDPSIHMEWRRLYIDIKGAVLPANFNKSIPINDGLLKMARAGQYDKDTVRVVLDIESIEDFKVFPLGDPYRIIIDVTGEKKAADKDGNGAGEAAAVPTDILEKKADAASVKKTAQRARKIVIDPGHGGKDPGAIGKGGLKEKDVTLKLGKMLRERLSSKINSKIIMTRDTDVFIPLEERTAIANSNDADLFVSIHINASPRRAASGVETYILNFSHDEEAKRVAARENASTRKALSDLEFILNDLIKTAKTNDSARLAEVVHDNLVKGLKAKFDGVKSNGVKGAPFYVLVGTKMPSILVEVSFISNPEEEQRLKDEKYLNEVIEGITTGVLSYINGAGQV